MVGGIVFFIEVYDSHLYLSFKLSYVLSLFKILIGVVRIMRYRLNHLNIGGDIVF